MPSLWRRPSLRGDTEWGRGPARQEAAACSVRSARRQIFRTRRRSWRERPDVVDLSSPRKAARLFILGSSTDCHTSVPLGHRAGSSECRPGRASNLKRKLCRRPRVAIPMPAFSCPVSGAARQPLADRRGRSSCDRARCADRPRQQGSGRHGWLSLNPCRGDRGLMPRSIWTTRTAFGLVSSSASARSGPSSGTLRADHGLLPSARSVDPKSDADRPGHLNYLAAAALHADTPYTAVARDRRSLGAASPVP